MLPVTYIGELNLDHPGVRTAPVMAFTLVTQHTEDHVPFLYHGERVQHLVISLHFVHKKRQILQQH